MEVWVNQIIWRPTLKTYLKFELFKVANGIQTIQSSIRTIQNVFETIHHTIGSYTIQACQTSFELI